MPQMQTRTLSFPASTSPDVVGYRLYMEGAPAPVTYASQSFDLGNNTSVELSTLPGMTTMDGIYNLGVTSIDDGGNESSMSTLDNVSLDFLAPNPPGPLSVV